MPASFPFVIGLLLGLVVAGGAVWAVVRSVGRAVGTDGGGAVRLVVDGLRPGSSPDGVTAQRALARRLRRTGRRTASGRRVAANEIELHVGPEDFALIEEAIGTERATDDLTEFYRAHASSNGWLVQGDPRIVLVRDISLRPRQSFARATTLTDPAPTAPLQSGSVPVLAAEVVTDVLPSAGFVDLAAVTLAYPAAELGVIAPGDLVVVHGTDVRTVPASCGRLTIGRSTHNNLVIDRPTIGLDHLVVERRGDAWWVVPGPPGGARLDGHLLEAPAPIDGQGLLELGRGVRVRLTVESSSGA